MNDDETFRTVLASAAAGDAAAFARIVELYHDDVARVAFVVSGDEELTSDAVQATWPEAWRGLATMRNPERLRAWLVSIAAREARRLTAAGPRVPEGTAGDSGLPATRASSAPAYRADELAVANALAPLDSHDRMIVGLRYVAGLTSVEIGRELSMPDGAVQARIARILARLLKDLQGAPTETIDHYERTLTQLVRSFGDRAVGPIDAAAVAHAAMEAAPEPGLPEQLGEVWERLRSVERFGWIVAAGLLVIVAVAAVVGGGAAGPPPIATPVPSDATRLCETDELDVGVVAWDAPGAERIATVEMRNVGTVACLVDSLPEPWLIERPRTPMLIGHDLQGSLIRIGPGDVLRTTVRVRNYCGPAPRPPVTVAFRRQVNVIAARALTATDLSGVPPCGGYAASKDDIQMQPWAP